MCYDLRMRSESARARWAFLLIISLGLFIVAADNSILYVALPTLRAELHTTHQQGLWIINAYPLVLAGLLLGTGTLGDKIGHRRMFEIGLTIFGIASAVAAFAPNVGVLIGARAFLGAGAAVLMPSTLALIRQTFFEPRERNTAIGIWGSVATVGSAVGPLLGGFLLTHTWWGAVFLINIPIVIIALAGTYLIAPDNFPNPKRNWDFISSLYATITMVGLVLTIENLAHNPIDTTLVTTGVVLFAIGLALFAHRQHFLDTPLLTLDVFKSRLFTAGFLGAFLGMFVVSGIEILTTQRFQLSAGFTPLQAGLVTGAVAIAAFPGAIFGGRYVDRIGFRRVISGGYVIATIAGILAVFAIREDLFPLFMSALVLVGTGTGLAMSVTSTAIIGSAPAHRTGMASAIESVSYEFGTMLSVAILGSLMSLFYTINAAPEVAHSMDTSAHNPALAPMAASAIDTAYTWTLCITIAVSFTAAVVTAALLADNPKETKYAHE